MTLTFLISPVTETDLIRYEAEKDAIRHQGEFYKRQLRAITEYGAKCDEGRPQLRRSKTLHEVLSSHQKTFEEERKSH